MLEPSRNRNRRIGRTQLPRRHRAENSELISVSEECIQGVGFMTAGPQAKLRGRYIGQKTETLARQHKFLSPAESPWIAHRGVAARHNAIGWPRDDSERLVEAGYSFLLGWESWPGYREQRCVDWLLCACRAGQKERQGQEFVICAICSPQRLSALRSGAMSNSVFL